MPLVESICMGFYFSSIAFQSKEVILRLSATPYFRSIVEGRLYPLLYDLRISVIGRPVTPGKLLRKFAASPGTDGTFKDAMRRSLRERFFISDLNQKELYLDLMTAIAEFDSILDDADMVHENRFKLSETESLTFDNGVDWHPGFEKIEKQEMIFSRRVRRISPGELCELESVLELNRFRQAIWLGKAYWISRSEAHADKFKELVVDWISKNPVGRGLNWTMPGEAAIRALNLIVGLLYFMKSTHLDEAFISRLLALLYEHGIFIRRNFELHRDNIGGRFAALAGMLCIGILFYDTKDGKRWVEFARREIEYEVHENISDDGTVQGTPFEDHCLATEALAVAHVLMKLNGYPISAGFKVRLENMFHFIATATMRDGTVPLDGKTRGARIFRMSSKMELNDHRGLLAAGAAIFGSAEARTAAGGFSELALLLLGGEGFEKYSAIAEGATISSAIYRQSGFAFMRSEKDFASFNFRQSRNSKENSGHNDLLSFTIAGKNQFIVDRMCCSSPDLTLGNRFDLTIAHNTLLIDGIEQADFTGPGGRGSVRPELLGWQTGEEQDSVEAQYHLRSGNAGILTHKRDITFNKHQRTFRVEDDLLGEGEHVIDMAFHFAPGLRVLDLGRNFLAIEGEEFALMKFQHPFRIEEWEVSTGSAGRDLAKTARVVLETSLPMRIETFIFITSSEDDMNYLLNRIRPGEFT